MSYPTPRAQSSAGRRVASRSALPVILLWSALGCAVSTSAILPDSRVPLPISGITGASFLTADVPAIRHFYGKGAGFAEAPGGHDTIRFTIGSNQWIEFTAVPKPSWPRRMLRVTLETPNLAGVESALRARGIKFVRNSWANQDRSIEIEDPAGNFIRIAEPQPFAAVAGGPMPFSRHLQHIGFAVDRAKEEATVQFYRDSLGWPEAVRMDNPDGRLGLVKFRLPGNRNDFIELIFYDPPLNKWAAGAFDHINFEVSDIDAAYQLLHQGG